MIAGKQQARLYILGGRGSCRAADVNGLTITGAARQEPRPPKQVITMYDDDEWEEDEEDDGCVPCQYCGEPIYEESGYCSSCERWQSREDRPQKTLPVWIMLTALFLLGIFVYSALRGF
jgi:predicted nucleic acid-binding Zn ribbon protein